MLSARDVQSNERDDPLGLGDRSREPLLAKCERYLDSLVPCSEPIAGIVRSAVLYEPPRNRANSRNRRAAWASPPPNSSQQRCKSAHAAGDIGRIRKRIGKADRIFAAAVVKEGCAGDKSHPDLPDSALKKRRA